MSTLLLRLAAPMQAWGVGSKFDTRDTGREPSKSGVLGLLAAALGIRRDDTAALDALTRLRFGVRVDREGTIASDYHIAHGIKKGAMLNKSFAELHESYLNLASSDSYYESYVTHRYYLCDAVFLCGLESEDAEILRQYVHALTHPAYPLFLGRRSCPPTLPLVLGVRDCDLETALQTEPRLVESGSAMRIVLDAAAEDTAVAVAKDVPSSFSPRRREFGYRRYREVYLPGNVQTEHDPFAEVEAENVSDAHGA